MSQSQPKPFQAVVYTVYPGPIVDYFEFLGEAIDFARGHKEDGAIFERDDDGDWQARYTLKDGEVISTRGLTRQEVKR